MKKLILVLMPLCIILAFFGYALSKDLNFSLLINGLDSINLQEFDYSGIRSAFDNLNFSNSLSSIASIWSDVDGLISFFTAIGDTFVTFFSTIGDFFVACYNIFIFTFDFLRYFILNLFEFIKYLFTYIFS